MILMIYLLIGLVYWAINSFVRKLEIDGDYLLPLFWFLGWPIALLTWMVILFLWAVDYSKSKFFKNQL